MAMLLDLLPTASDLLGGIVSIQHQPVDPYWDDPYMYEEPESSIGFGTIIGIVFLGVALNCLFGWWGKSRAEDTGVNPWIGFAMGFCFGFLGVMLVPVFRVDRVMVTHNAPPPMPPSAPNPMYSGGTQAYPQQGYAPPQQQGHGQPPLVQQQYAPPPPQPPPHAHSMQPEFQPAPQQPTEPAEMLVADEYGYVECPHCGTRTKSGRKSCMSCGNFLPPVYDPNIK